MTSETVGQRLKRLRLERDLSQRELARPGVSYAYISRIEAGTRTPSMKALRKLAAALDVTPHYLETGGVDPVEVERERARRVLELAKEWRTTARFLSRRVAALEDEGRATPDPTDLKDALLHELRDLRERTTHDLYPASRTS